MLIDQVVDEGGGSQGYVLVPTPEMGKYIILEKKKRLIDPWFLLTRSRRGTSPVPHFGEKGYII